MKPLIFCPPFLFLATAPLGLGLGGPWSFLTLITTPAALCLFDACFRSSSEPGDEPRGVASYLPAVYVGCQLALTAGFGFLIAAGRLSPLETLGTTLSAGLTAGVFGNVSAHDLIHRPARWERGLGLVMLASVANMQFRISHLHGHHRRAATRQDPATARTGESAYRFVLRSLWGQLEEAWRFEQIRMQRRARGRVGLSNRLLQYGLVELGLAASIAALAPAALLFWLGQALIAIVMMELFNYIAHYGLLRRQLSPTRFEAMGPQHSWNTGRRMNNWSLFNMGRHGDHHRRPAGRYATLKADRFAPELPTGYAGAILLCLVPPLWRRTMDPRAEIWADVDGTPEAMERAADAQHRLLRRS